MSIVRANLMDMKDNIASVENLPDEPLKSGPCRASAFSILEQRVSELRRKLVGLEALLATFRGLEVGSPEEIALWDILHSRCF